MISVGGNDVATGVSLARHRLNLANILDDAASTGVATFVVSPPPTDDQTINDKLGVLVEAQADVLRSSQRAFVDCYSPLLGHDQWQSDLAASAVPHHPGQAGYGLIAWLVLHNGWNGGSALDTAARRGRQVVKTTRCRPDLRPSPRSLRGPQPAAAPGRSWAGCFGQQRISSTVRARHGCPWWTR